MLGPANVLMYNWKEDFIAGQAAIKAASNKVVKT
jgi:hypothetical protein